MTLDTENGKLRNRLGLMLILSIICGACGDDSSSLSPFLSVRILTYNIGNPSVSDPDYPLRLKDQAYEDYIGEQVRFLEADIVMLQEVMPPEHCESFLETDPTRTCYDATNRPPQVRRILGPEYTIVCDERSQLECIGIRKDFGMISGVKPGDLLLSGAQTPPLPLPACDWTAGDCDNDTCGESSTVSAVSVETATGRLRLVNMHPTAPGIGTGGYFSGSKCRALQVAQVFEGLPEDDEGPLVNEAHPTIIAGDFNMDPDRFAGEGERSVWTEHVGEGRRFTDFSPRDASGVAYATRRNSFSLAIDHVLADRASGKCAVFGRDPSFGPDSGTDPLDNGFDWSVVENTEDYPGRIDHFAILCDLIVDFSHP
jgi:hypothetical protein